MRCLAVVSQFNLHCNLRNSSRIKVFAWQFKNENARWKNSSQNKDKDTLIFMQ